MGKKKGMVHLEIFLDSKQPCTGVKLVFRCISLDKSATATHDVDLMKIDFASFGFLASACYSTSEVNIRRAPAGACMRFCGF